MSAKKLLLIVAVILFAAAGVGFAEFKVGTVALDLDAFGLACFAGSFLFV
jgi:hypothetical protein